jgi:effector-binding domain-containing protein
LGSFSAAVIRDQEAEDIAQFIAEVEEENRRFDAKLEELEKRAREKEEEEKERWRAAAI